MKLCNKCKQPKELSQFEKASDSPDGLRSQCKSCRNEQRKLRYYKRDVTEPIKTEKFCPKCKVVKPNVEYYKVKRNHDGLSSQCIECGKKRSNLQYQTKKEHIKKTTIAYYKNNKEKITASRRERSKIRRKTDIKYKLKRNLRNRLYYALKRTTWKKDTHFSQYIGCSSEQLKLHIESGFDCNMNWNNYGKYWDIDHIIPLSAAKTEQELYRLCHFSNLKPVESVYNRIHKRDKIPSPKELYTVDFLDKQIAKEIIIVNHYLHRNVNSTYCFGLFDSQMNVLGVMLFSHPLSPQIKSKYKDQKILELTRMWVDDLAVKNSESFFIAKCIKKLKVDLIISYADPAQGHQGIVYKAANFKYLGLTKKTLEYKVKGLEEKTSYILKGKTVKQLKDLYGEENIYTQYRQQKHIYLYTKK